MHPALGRALVPDLDQEDALGRDLGIVADLALDLDHDPGQEIAGALLEKGEVIQDPGPNQDHLNVAETDLHQSHVLGQAPNLQAGRGIR